MLVAVAALPARVAREVRDDRFLLVSILLGVALASAIIWRLSQLWHVPGGDGGQWLMISHFYLGRGAPEYAHPSGYPPLFFLFLACFVAVLGDLPGLLAAVGSMYLLLPPAMYILGRSLSGDRPRALVFSALASLGPALPEMSSWGAYPNLFSILFLAPALIFLKRSWVTGSPRDLRLLGLFTALVLLSHALTTAIFAVFLVLAFAFGILGNGREWVRDRLLKGLRHALPVALAPVIPFLVFQSVRGDSFPEWTATMPAPPAFSSYKTLYQKLDFTGQLAWLPDYVGLGDPFFWLSVVIVAILCFWLLRLAKRARMEGAGRSERSRRLASTTLWCSFMLAPLLLAFGLAAAGAGLNQPRLAYYLIFPAAALLAWWAGAALKWSRPLVGRGHDEKPESTRGAREDRMKPGRLHRPAVIAILTLVTVLWAGWGAYAFEGNARYYSFFEDPEDRDLVSWISSSTPADAILVTPPHAFKWLQGLTGRAALSYQEPWHILREDERMQSEYTYQIHNHRLSADNGPNRVRVQSFGDRSEFSPAIESTDGLLYRGLWFPRDGFVLKWDTANGTPMERNLSAGFLTSVNMTIAGGEIKVSMRADSVEAGVVFINTTLHAGSSSARLDVVWLSVPGTPKFLSFVAKAPPEWWDSKGERTPAGFDMFDARAPATRVSAVFTPPPDAALIIDGDGVARPSATLGFVLANLLPPRVTAEIHLPPSQIPFEPPQTLFTPDLIAALRVTHVIALKGGAAEWLLPGEFAYPLVYSNARYVVFATGL